MSNMLLQITLRADPSQLLTGLGQAQNALTGLATAASRTADAANQGMGNTNHAVTALAGGIGQANSGMANLATSTGMGMRGAMQAAGNARLAIVGLVASLTGVAFPVTEAMAFESAMANVKKVVDFPTPTAFAAMSNQILELSRQIPMAATGLADIAAAGGQLGVTAKDIPAFTEVVSKMAVAFDMTAERAGEQMAKLANIWSLPVTDLTGLGDAINHISNNMAAKAPLIIDVMQRISGSAKMFGITKEQSAALAASFIALGAAPEVAATGINAMFMRMQAASRQSADFQKGLKSLGMEAHSLEQAVAMDANKALMGLLATLSRLDTTSRMGVLSDLFGAEYAPDIAKVAGAMDTLRKAMGLQAKEANYAGSIQQEFATKAETTANRAQLLRNQINELAICLGDQFLPAVKAGLEGVTDLTRGLLEGAKAAIQWGKDNVTEAMWVGGALGGVALAWSVESGAMIAGIAAVTGALGSAATASLAFAATPIGALAIAAGVAFAGLAIYLNRGNKELEEQNRKQKEAIKNYSDTIGQISRMIKEGVKMSPALAAPLFDLRKAADEGKISFKQAETAAKEYADKVIEGQKRVAAGEGRLAGLQKEYTDTVKREWQDALKTRAKATEEAISAAMSNEDKLREIKRRGMSEEEAEADKLVQINEKLADVRELVNQSRSNSTTNPEQARQAAEYARREAEEVMNLASSLENVGDAYYVARAASKADQEAMQSLINIGAQLRASDPGWDDKTKSINQQWLALDDLNQELKKVDTTRTSVKVQADIGPALADLQRLRGELAALSQQVTIPVNIQTSAQHAGGGLIQPVAGFAGGGPVMNSGIVPGVGFGDTVPRLLPAGAFVIRQPAMANFGSLLKPMLGLAGGGLVSTLLTPGEGVASPLMVRRFGVGIFQAINAMQLSREQVAALTGVARRATGGLVTGSSAPVEGVVRLEFGDGARQGSLFGSRASVGLLTTLLQEVREAQRGMA